VIVSRSYYQIINLVFLNRENGEKIIINSERQRMLYAYSTICRMRSVHQQQQQKGGNQSVVAGICVATEFKVLCNQ